MLKSSKTCFPLAAVSRVLLSVCMVAVLTLALLPESAETPDVMSSHVLNHLVAFASVSALLRLGWPKLAFWQVIVIASLFGALIETLQWGLTTDREMSLVDLATNFFGTLFGVSAATILLMRCRNHA